MLARWVEILPDTSSEEYNTVVMKPVKVCLYLNKCVFCMKVVLCKIAEVEKQAKCSNYVGRHKVCDSEKIDL